MNGSDEIRKQLDALGDEAVALLQKGRGSPSNPERYTTIMGVLRRAQRREGHASRVIQRIEAAAKTPQELSEIHRVAESALDHLARAQADTKSLLAVAHRLGDQYLISELTAANGTLKKTITLLGHVERRAAVT